MAYEGSSYNGYNNKERDDNFKELKRRLASGKLPSATVPCALCGDPEPKTKILFEYHNEDYGMDPFLDKEPALFALCRNCHRDKLHKRFWKHKLWQAFLAHVRRGGYARDLTEDPIIRKEFDAFRAALERGDSPTPVLRQLRPYKRKIGTEGFANLRMDEQSLTDPLARPRP